MLTVLWRTKITVSFLVEDKNIVNEYHAQYEKAMTPHRKKCPYLVDFNVPRDWFEINSQHQKHYSEDA